MEIRKKISEALKEMTTLQKATFVAWQISLVTALIAWVWLGRNYFFYNITEVIVVTLSIVTSTVLWAEGIFAQLFARDTPFRYWSEVFYIITMVMPAFWLDHINKTFLHIECLKNIGYYLLYALIFFGVIALILSTLDTIKELKQNNL